tara:strand:+ start:4009 stop:4926 length:918 start_codon:yes stop_codon:yes gene_type:complete
MVEAPILFIAFNRPDTTKVVFQRLRELKPRKLYVTIDGPREGRKQEVLLCDEVHEICKNIDWECQVKYKVREKNLGCRNAIVDAISWVLAIEDRVIIIEDDVVPEFSFFDFANELLEKYKNDEKVGMISANNYTPLEGSKEDYHFSNYAHIWGWATWRRAWNIFDIDCPEMKEQLKRRNFNNIISGKKERKYFKWFFNLWLDRKKKGTADAWGPYWFFNILFKNQFSIVPKSNLAKNIGTEGLHTNSQNSQHFRPTSSDYKIQSHPNKVIHSSKYDQYHFENHIYQEVPPTILKRISIKFSNLIK